MRVSEVSIIYICICRDEGPRREYWAMGHAQGQTSANEGDKYWAEEEVRT